MLLMHYLSMVDPFFVSAIKEKKSRYFILMTRLKGFNCLTKGIFEI